MSNLTLFLAPVCLMLLVLVWRGRVARQDLLQSLKALEGLYAVLSEDRRAMREDLASARSLIDRIAARKEEVIAPGDEGPNDSWVPEAQWTEE